MGATCLILYMALRLFQYRFLILTQVVYIADGAIAEMIREKRRGRFLFVSANAARFALFCACCFISFLRSLGVFEPFPVLEPPKAAVSNSSTLDLGKSSEPCHLGPVSVNPIERNPQGFLLRTRVDYQKGPLGTHGIQHRVDIAVPVQMFVRLRTSCSQRTR